MTNDHLWVWYSTSILGTVMLACLLTGLGVDPDTLGTLLACAVLAIWLIPPFYLWGLAVHEERVDTRRRGKKRQVEEPEEDLSYYDEDGDD